jgi:hypothetical protein
LFAFVRKALVLCLVLAPLSAFPFADWQPTADELSMKSYAPDPNAPAVFLYREETVDDNIHMHSMYARIKILSEKGKEMFGDIELPYEASAFTVDNINGRTIHSDGTVVPFTGKPYDKLLVKEGNRKVNAKVFSMPDVQVGSIIEFRYKLHYQDNILSSPYWQIEQEVPVLKAHYHFVSSSSLNGNLRGISSMEYGHQLLDSQLLYTSILPSGTKVVQRVDGSYDVDVENIPAMPNEDYLPPFQSLTYRVVFYYSPFRTSGEYWKTLGKYWSSDFNHFADPSSKIRSAVNGIVAPGDSDEVKAQKIYAAVMKLENTSFTREHSIEENKDEGLKVKTADDIWTQQRGDMDEITRLFVAMARAAGLKAYGAIVVNRDNDIFQQAFLEWRGQMDDELAIVSIDGKEVFFDPGQRYCEYGRLHWKHTWAGGVRQTGDGTDLFITPGPSYKDNSIDRFAQLTLDPDGHVEGLIREAMTGANALQWRQAALTGDEAGIKKKFEEELQRSMPPGVQVKTNHFIGLTDISTPLMVVVNVRGTLGTATGKHIFLPAVFFESGNAPRFAASKRDDPVDMHFPYFVHDQFQITLPPNVTVDTVPAAGAVPFAPNADYVAKFASPGNIYAYGRLLRVASVFYTAAEYPQLRDFFQKVSADDQAQVALKVAPVTAATTAPAASGK